MKNPLKTSHPATWVGWIIKMLVVLFLLVDAIMKLIQHPIYVKGTTALGVPEGVVAILGAYLLIATLLYTLPKTALTGMLMLMAYLGGAVAVTMVSAKAGHPYLFPVVFGAIIYVVEIVINPGMRDCFTGRKFVRS